LVSLIKERTWGSVEVTGAYEVESNRRVVTTAFEELRDWYSSPSVIRVAKSITI
jgi:hypothetical protein